MQVVLGNPELKEHIKPLTLAEVKQHPDGAGEAITKHGMKVALGSPQFKEASSALGAQQTVRLSCPPCSQEQ